MDIMTVYVVIILTATASLTIAPRYENEVFSTLLPRSYSPAGLPSRGADVTVYVLHINQPSFPILFILFLCLFLSLWPFQLCLIP